MTKIHLGGLSAGLLCLTGPAAAELFVGLGLEYLHWEEDTTPVVEENGPLLAASLGYTQEKDRGLLFAYRGRAYFGDVDYDGAGLFTGTPRTGTTRYVGMANEGQLRWRQQVEKGYHADYLLALGWDSWERELSASQRENYDVAYLRLGGEMTINEGQGWIAGAGIKYPVYVREDAHLTEIGFDRNPVLEPGRDVSPYATLGYRIDDKLSVVAYYESFIFRQSQEEAVTHPLTGPTVVFQPASTLSLFGFKLDYRLK